MIVEPSRRFVESFNFLSDLEALDVVEDDCLPVPELGQQMLDEGLQLHGDGDGEVSVSAALDTRYQGRGRLVMGSWTLHTAWCRHSGEG